MCHTDFMNDTLLKSYNRSFNGGKSRFARICDNVFSALLLTAALYFKGSPRLYNWLLNHRHFGPYISNFRENKAIPLRAKIISLVLMWGTMLYCIFFLIPFLWVKILLGLVAAGVTYHILSFKTLK